MEEMPETGLVLMVDAKGTREWRKPLVCQLTVGVSGGTRGQPRERRAA
jgi:hypothetical protein